MGHIALEEAFSIPELTERQPCTEMRIRAKTEYAAVWSERLVDFEKYRIPDMDSHGIDIQVLALSVPGIQADVDPAAAVENAVFANNYLAGVISRYPRRFRGFAALPLQDPDAAVRELERCVTDLGFVGAFVNDHTHGRYLDDPVHDELWSALEELSVPLYLHPGSLPVDDWAVLGGHPELYGANWSWQAETGGHAMRLLFGGVFDRHPRAVLILGHLGEFLPFQQTRFDSRYRTLQVETPIKRLPSAYFGTNIVVTTTGVFAPEVIQAAVLNIGAEAVLFSVDYPYEDTAAAVAAVANAALPLAVKRQIFHENARRLLRLEQ
ncbi:amidohydrolase family protein [Streptomyces sp. NPDC002701]|uniref:amidohydrolase family protein n=1 Tax=Streptomyces sp. NPDC002701 TaxID=3364661 RepID=UPI0036CA3AB6